MDNIEYKYFMAKVALDQKWPDRFTDVLFRQNGELIEVRVRRTMEAPEEEYWGERQPKTAGVSFKAYMKTLRNKSKGLKEVKINTEISTTDGYGHDWPSAMIVISGWTSHLSNSHKIALKMREVTRKTKGFNPSKNRTETES